MCSSDVKGLAYYDHYATGSESVNYLPVSLAARDGMRPIIGKWAAPHRQLDAKAEGSSKKSVRNIFSDLASKQPLALKSGPSIIEGGSPALFVSSERALPNYEYYKKAPYEIIHMHETDGSLHCTLSGADARLLIERGWGERHGLNGKVGFPRGYLMVYAPRNEDDLDAIRWIVKAAVQYGLDGENPFED